MDIILLEGDDPFDIGGIALVWLDGVEQLGQALFAKQGQRHFNAQVGLNGRDVPGVQETLQVCRSGVWCVELGKRRRYQKNRCLQITSLYKSSVFVAGVRGLQLGRMGFRNDILDGPARIVRV